MKGKQRHAIAGRKLEETAVREADAFRALEPREQALQKPGMWIGGVVGEPATLPCFDGVTIKRKDIPDFNPGVNRCFIEILNNSVDNCIYSILCGRRPDSITVSLSDKTIIIENGGCNVPVQRMKDGTWIPTMLWGFLFSSSHYDEAKKKYKQSNSGSGTNGVGASLVNIYSTSFKVTVEDPESCRRFKQSWSHCLPDGEPEIIADGSIDETLVRIEWTLDFPFFGMEKYSPMMIEVLAFHVITASFTAKVPVHYINEQLGIDKIYDVSLISDYAALFPELRVAPSQILEYHFLSRDDADYVDVVRKHMEIPRIEVMLFDEVEQAEEEEVQVKKKGKATAKKPTNAFQLSFVNGIFTNNGGVHVDCLVDAFFGEALKKLDIKVKEGKRHISFLLSVRVPDPSFSSQSKEELKYPKPSFAGIPAEIIRGLESWDTLRRLKELNEAVKQIALKKTDGKKVRRTDVRNLIDANNAGTSKSEDCVLFIVEGSSASTYVENLLNYLHGGRDIYGIFQLRGKFANVFKKIAELVAIKMYMWIKQAIGLQEGIDYSVRVNYKKLRYGKVLIATDADCDGWHILSLLILLFHTRFPSLMSRDFITYLRTPVLTIRTSGGGMSFYTKQAYAAWRELSLREGGKKGDMAKVKPTYRKGLGSASVVEVEQDSKADNLKIPITDADNEATESLDLVFKGDRTDDRKLWLKTPVKGIFLETVSTYMTISHVIHTGLKLYSLDNLQRAIPGIMDGCKESQRKVLYTAINKFKLTGGDRKASAAKTSKDIKKYPEAKIFAIVAKTTDDCKYHHGEMILAEVVANMTKDYVGTNNVTWFHPASSCGTRETGKAPNARYAMIGPAWWWSYVYNQEDFNLVNFVEDEGESCEPQFLLPVACWSLCNSADGVGTGYSTRIPGHNIEEVALAHLCLLEGHSTFPPLLPWWRGFRGTVSLVPRVKARKMEITEEEIDEDVQEEPSNPEGVKVDSPSDDEVSEEGSSAATPKPRVRTKVKTDQASNGSEKPARKRVKVVDPESMICVIEGIYTVEGNIVTVTELPLRTFKEFRETLGKLIDAKIVQDFKNLSGKDYVKFVIEMVVDENGKLPQGNIVKLFKSRRVISMSNLVLLDENGLPRRFKSSNDILVHFHAVRLEYYEKRRMWFVQKLKKNLENLDQRRRLVEALTVPGPNRISWEGRSKDEVLQEIALKLPDIDRSIYDELPFKSVNRDEIEKLQKKIDEARKALEEMEATTKEKLWKADLLDFLKEYRKICGSNVSEHYKHLQW
jgi:DNA topoisomerase-2